MAFRRPLSDCDRQPANVEHQRRWSIETLLYRPDRMTTHQHQHLTIRRRGKYGKQYGKQGLTPRFRVQINLVGPGGQNALAARGIYRLSSGRAGGVGSCLRVQWNICTDDPADPDAEEFRHG